MLLAATERALAHRLALVQSDGRTPSVVAAVVRDGRTVWSGARSSAGPVPHPGPETPGPAATGPECDPEPGPGTQYRIGSLTKALVAVVVLRLRDEGLIDLADPLERHLPGTQAPTATIAQLLAHTAAVPAEPRGPWWERTPGELRPDLGDLLDGEPRPLPPGRRHHYSNPGYAYLGALVERLRGEGWFEALRREVLEPLGMRNTTLLPRAPHVRGWAVAPWADVLLEEPLADTGTMAPAGQLWSTTDDLARFAAFLAGDGGRDVLSADTLVELRTPNSPPAHDNWDASHGLGVQLLRTPPGWPGTEQASRALVGHSGSMPGFLACLLVDPQERVGAVVLTNATSGPAVMAAGSDLIRIVLEHEPRFPEPWRPLSAADADPELVALTGPWYWGAAPFVLRLRPGRALELGPLSGPGRRTRLSPEEDGTWRGLDGYFAGETLRLCRAPDGSVSHLDLATFVFTRKPYDPDAPVPGGSRGWTD
ncbi:beta-lactamase family protein [Streptomyces sp. XM4193]|uniref:serine hydrolase domain-containing protein n=1 Tax=Streptomyces sp. XM4193 TaxID=2929782 RepID=UPI001FF8C25E|nr:serine hydrolase domain-containing protein [Streptomyces sp. XM4193]MCK1795691.1 beta-lactamase family protein [Streptomyces sp. XM4193]